MMVGMDIPDEAIEAAVEAIHESFTTSDKPDGHGGWKDATVYGGPGEIALAVLKAVAPRLQEEAWAEGHLDGWGDRTLSLVERRTAQEEVDRATPNPYRRQA